MDPPSRRVRELNKFEADSVPATKDVLEMRSRAASPPERSGGFLVVINGSGCNRICEGFLRITKTLRNRLEVTRCQKQMLSSRRVAPSSRTLVDFVEPDWMEILVPEGTDGTWSQKHAGDISGCSVLLRGRAPPPLLSTPALRPARGKEVGYYGPGPGASVCTWAGRAGRFNLETSNWLLKAGGAARILTSASD